MTDQQKAVALIINCLLGLGVSANMGERYNKDLWKAAELLGVSKVDLLKTIVPSPDET